MAPNATETQDDQGRKYRSKRQRPCDLCRSRKVTCRLHTNASCCETCQKLSRSCTFVMAPLKRREPRISDGGQVPVSKRPTVEREPSRAHPFQEQPGLMDLDWPRSPGNEWSFPMSLDVADSPWAGMMFPIGDNLSVVSPRGPDNHTGEQQSLHSLESLDLGARGGSGGASVASTLSEKSTTAQVHTTLPTSITNSFPAVVDASTSTWSSEWSLDKVKGRSPQLVGLSSESDPYLLRNYSYDSQETYLMFRLHFRRILDFSNSNSTNAGLPIHFSMTDEDIWTDELKATENLFSGSVTEEADLELLRGLVSSDLGQRLLNLYHRFVHPQFPVLSEADLHEISKTSETSSLPAGLTSAVYALAAPFSYLDDELSVSKGYVQVATEDLWTIAYRSFRRASSSARLSCLQLCLLILQRPPCNFAVADPPNAWALSCSALALAESFGLHLDPSGWQIPREEIMLRRRLWWLTFREHIWQAIVLGRSSHINDDNWEVSPLHENDFEVITDLDPAVSQANHDPKAHVIARCELDVIAASIMKEFYTIKAARSSLSLSALFEKARPFRDRLETWHSRFALDSALNQAEQGPSLRLCHLTLEILVQRALLRPLVQGLDMGLESDLGLIQVVLDNAYTTAKSGTEIVSALGAKQFAGFWQPYVRFQLCYISTFILLRFAQSPVKEDAARQHELLNEWRSTLRTQARVWPLAKLATIRLDAIFWKGLSTVVRNTGPESPAMLYLAEQKQKATSQQAPVAGLT